MLLFFMQKIDKLNQKTNKKKELHDSIINKNNQLNYKISCIVFWKNKQLN